jgi:hypothetical protein
MPRSTKYISRVQLRRTPVHTDAKDVGRKQRLYIRIRFHLRTIISTPTPKEAFAGVSPFGVDTLNRADQSGM